MSFLIYLFTNQLITFIMNRKNIRQYVHTSVRPTQRAQYGLPRPPLHPDLGWAVNIKLKVKKYMTRPGLTSEIR